MDLVLLVLGLGGDGSGDGGAGRANGGRDGAGVGGDRLEAGRYDPQRARQQPIPSPLPPLHPSSPPLPPLLPLPLPQRGDQHKHPLRLQRPRRHRSYSPRPATPPLPIHDRRLRRRRNPIPSECRPPLPIPAAAAAAIRPLSLAPYPSSPRAPRRPRRRSSSPSFPSDADQNRNQQLPGFTLFPSLSLSPRCCFRVPISLPPPLNNPKKSHPVCLSPPGSASPDQSLCHTGPTAYPRVHEAFLGCPWRGQRGGELARKGNMWG